MIAKERYDLTDLVSAAIKTTYNTRSPGGVERCIDVLNHLKSLPFSGKEIRLCNSIGKLESLRSHRHPKIRKEAQDLFDFWAMKLYAQGRNNSFKAARTKIRLNPKKPILVRRRSELKKIEDERSLKTQDAIEVKKTTGFWELRKKDDQRSLTREAQGGNKKKTSFLELKKREDEKPHQTKIGFSELKKKEDEKYLKNKTKPDLRKRGDACEAVTTKKPREEVKVTTKNLIPPPRRNDKACKMVESSGNPKTKEELEKKKTELVELFEAAKRAADVANTKGILSGKPEASRCVEALELLMRIKITPKPNGPRRMMERLEGLTKHKDRKICHAASTLLLLWRQRIRKEEHSRL